MNVLITGAARGLGRALALKFVREGHSVYACHRARPDEPNAARAPEGTTSLYLDVEDVGSIYEARIFLEQRGVRLDAIINNAGVIYDFDTPLNETSLPLVEKCLNVNTMGPMRVCQCLRPLLAKGAVIANISSEAALLSLCGDNRAGYCMSKAALNVYTLILAHDLAADGGIAFAIHPGRMNTDMGRKVAQIEPEESAEGIYRLIAERCVENGAFVDYRGKAMAD